MKILEIGICQNNKDPKGIGRIRVSAIDEIDSARSNAIPVWKQWSKDDPFVYSPFLPNHINIIPQEGQAVKLIRYDSKKDLVNQEYVPGPFTTSHNFTYQNELSQTTETTYGLRAQKAPSIKSFTGQQKVYDEGFLRAESVGSLPKLEDIGISGNYGSDIILTEHGVQLRAGKLIDKTNAPKQQKDDLELYPMYSKKHSKISLKKFPTTVKLDYKEIIETILNRGDIKHVFEYSVNSLTTPTEFTVNLYRVNTTLGEKYKTDVFSVNTELDNSVTELIYTLTTPLEMSSTQEKLQEAYIQIRDFISRLDREKLTIIDPSLQEIYPHPIFFRPTTSLRNQPNSGEFLKNIVYGNKEGGYGLLFSNTSIDAPLTPKKTVIPYLKKVNDVDQTFAATTADQILSLSTTPSGTGTQIDFGGLDKYEYTQEDYIMRILPNTFSSVRGEKLIEILEIVVTILLNHTHGICTEPKYSEEVILQLRNLMGAARQNMVNASIRIN